MSISSNDKRFVFFIFVKHEVADGSHGQIEVPVPNSARLQPQKPHFPALVAIGVCTLGDVEKSSCLPTAHPCPVHFQLADPNISDISLFSQEGALALE